MRDLSGISRRPGSVVDATCPRSHWTARYPAWWATEDEPAKEPMKDEDRAWVSEIVFELQQEREALQLERSALQEERAGIERERLALQQEREAMEQERSMPQRGETWTTHALTPSETDDAALERLKLRLNWDGCDVEAEAKQGWTLLAYAQAANDLAAIRAIRQKTYVTSVIENRERGRSSSVKTPASKFATRPVPRPAHVEAEKVGKAGANLPAPPHAKAMSSRLLIGPPQYTKAMSSRLLIGEPVQEERKEAPPRYTKAMSSRLLIGEPVQEERKEAGSEAGAAQSGTELSRSMPANMLAEMRRAPSRNLVRGTLGVSYLQRHAPSGVVDGIDEEKQPSGAAYDASIGDLRRAPSRHLVRGELGVSYLEKHLSSPPASPPNEASRLPATTEEEEMVEVEAVNVQ